MEAEREVFPSMFFGIFLAGVSCFWLSREVVGEKAMHNTLARGGRNALQACFKQAGTLRLLMALEGLIQPRAF